MQLLLLYLLLALVDLLKHHKQFRKLTIQITNFYSKDEKLLDSLDTRKVWVSGLRAGYGLLNDNRSLSLL